MRSSILATAAPVLLSALGCNSVSSATPSFGVQNHPRDGRLTTPSRAAIDEAVARLSFSGNSNSASVAGSKVSAPAPAPECNSAVDSFCNSDPPCNCSSFCAGECAINATSSAQNVTLYRMTMQGVLGLAEKDSGDVSGDLGFVLSQRTSALRCREDPANAMCLSLPHFAGDDDNSTDLVLEFKVEVDGQWGPYLYCNPVNNSVPTGEWACLPSLDSLGPAGASATCSATYDAYPVGGWNWRAFPVPKTLSDVGLPECCDAAGDADHAFWTYHANNRTCVYGGYPPASGAVYTRDEDSVFAMPSKYAPPTCNCTRAQRSVGIRRMTPDYSVVGGFWYSHPAAGECAPGTSVGTDGCTWRVVEITNSINASCMYRAVDAAVEALAPDCFEQCAQPLNKTSTCYLECFANATATAVRNDPAVLLKPWTDSMAGHCPTVPLPLPLPATRPRPHP